MLTQKGRFNISETHNRLKTLMKTVGRSVGTIAVTHFVENFRKQGFDDAKVEPWKPRQVFPPFEKQNAGRAILTGYWSGGKLKKSIRILSISGDKIVVGTEGLPYANIHNTGGIIRQTPTQKQRGYFKYLYSQSRNNLWLNASRSSQLTINIPQRKFIGLSVNLNTKTVNFINKAIKGCFYV